MKSVLIVWDWMQFYEGKMSEERAVGIEQYKNEWIVDDVYRKSIFSLGERNKKLNNRKDTLSKIFMQADGNA